jgi:hypothetical protein
MSELEIYEPDEEVVEHRSQGALGLFDTNDPKRVMEKATEIADILKDVLVQRKLISKIGPKEYIQVEGWTALGALLGLSAITEWSRPLQAPDGAVLGWEAAVEVVNGRGVTVGRAEAQVMRTERNWARRDEYALRSMAQTRAMGKAFRMPLGWIAVLAGYEATPAEEMPTNSKVPVEPEIEGSKAEIQTRLEAELERLKEKPEWSLQKICEAAKLHWNKDYTKLNQFTKDELTAVLRAALDS